MQLLNGPTRFCLIFWCIQLEQSCTQMLFGYWHYMVDTRVLSVGQTSHHWAHTSKSSSTILGLFSETCLFICTRCISFGSNSMICPFHLNDLQWDVSERSKYPWTDNAGWKIKTEKKKKNKTVNTVWNQWACLGCFSHKLLNNKH